MVAVLLTVTLSVVWASMEAAGQDRSKCKVCCIFPKAFSSGCYFSAYSVCESMVDAGLDMLMKSLLEKLPNQNVASKISLSNRSNIRTWRYHGVFKVNTDVVFHSRCCPETMCQSVLKQPASSRRKQPFTADSIRQMLHSNDRAQFTLSELITCHHLNPQKPQHVNVNA